MLLLLQIYFWSHKKIIMNLLKLEKEIYKKTKVEFNIGSPKQLSDVLFNKLKDVNQRLWDTEHIIRSREKEGNFDEEFVKHARLDAIINDERFLVKNEINNHCESVIKEQKSYEGLYSAD